MRHLHGTTNPRGPPTLRQSLGRALVEKLPLDLTIVLDDREEKERHEFEGGTPGMSQPGQELTPSWKRIVVLHDDPPVHKTIFRASPTEAQLELISVYLPTAPQDAGVLSLALTKKVENEGLVSGYSSVVVALACTLVAEFAMGGEFLPDEAPEHLKANYHAVRSAYNALWLQRDKLRPLIHKFGTSVKALPKPLDVNDKPHKVLIQQDLRVKAEMAARAKDHQKEVDGKGRYWSGDVLSSWVDSIDSD